MSRQIPLSAVTFTPASAADETRGLLGWVRLTLDGGLLLDGVTLRRTRDGRHTLSFPVRHDRSGRQHPIVRPIDADARRRIEAEIFAALNLDTNSPRNPISPAESENIR